MKPHIKFGCIPRDILKIGKGNLEKVEYCGLDDFGDY